ncbi:MAG TPA: hypothetical protein ACHBX0_14235 [Arsenophonus sp.]
MCDPTGQEQTANRRLMWSVNRAKNTSAEKHQQLKTELTTLTASLAREETPNRPISLGRIRDTDTLTNC